MASTSTIDQHAVNRARLVERLATAATELGYKAEHLPDGAVRRTLLHWIGENEKRPLADTTWVLLAIRLGGDI